MQKRVFKVFLIFSVFLIINNCTSEPNPPFTNGYAYLDKTFIELPETAVLNVSSQSPIVNLTNIGEGYLIFNFDTTASIDAFSYSTSCSGLLNVGESCTIIFQFAPNRIGEYSNDFKIINAVDGSVTAINLKAKAIANNYEPTIIPGLSVNSNQVKFPDQAISTRSIVKEVEIKNITPTPITLNYAISGNKVDTDAFLVKSTCIQGNSLGALESCKFSISFVPQLSSTYQASIDIESSPANKVSIPVIGKGVIQPKFSEQTGVIGLTISTLNINYYEGNIDNKSNPRYLVFTNSTATDIELKYTDPASEEFSLRFLGTTCFFDNVSKIINIPAGRSCDVAVNFIPKNATNYTDKLDFTYLNKTFTVKLEGRGQHISSGIMFGYVSPADFSSTSAPVYKKAVFLNDTQFAVKTSNIIIQSYDKDNNLLLDANAVFKLEDNASCENIILNPYQSCSLTVAFYIDQTATPMPTPQAYRGEIIINSAFGGGSLGKLNVIGSTSENALAGLMTLTIPNMNIDIMTSSVTVGQKVYFYGGRFDNATKASLLRYYDYSNGSVVTLNPSGLDMVKSFGEKRGGYLSGANIMEYNGKLIVYGGRFRVNYTSNPLLDPSKPEEDLEFSTHRDDNIYIYDPNDRTFSQDGAWSVVKTKGSFLPTMMVGASSVIYNDKIYFFGGRNFDGKPIDEATRFKTYDLGKNEWENITSKIVNLNDTYSSRVFSSATIFNNVLYIYGGTANIDDFINYNKNMYLIDFNTQTATTVGNIVALEPGGITPGFGSMTGDTSSCVYKETGDVIQTEIGPCRPYRLKLVNGKNRLFTTTGMLNATGIDILGPWGFLPNVASSSGVWQNLTSTYGNIRFPAHELITSIDGVLTALGGDKLHFFHVD